jgi:MoxR-like ATPase
MTKHISVQTFDQLEIQSILDRDIIGNDTKEMMEELIDLIFMDLTPYLFGPSGSGKSHMAKLLAAKYASMLGVSAYYVQNSPEVTKTSLIGGMRLVQGTTEAVIGLIAHAMEQGAIVIFDEATHARDASSLTMLNSILDEDHITAIGDLTIQADDRFRMIICSNDDRHVGNIALPQSFSRRLYNYKIDYPSYETEFELAITMAKNKYEKGQENKRKVYANLSDDYIQKYMKGKNKKYTPKQYTVPEVVAKFLTGYIRNVRTDRYPLSVSHIHKALIRLQYLEYLKTRRGNAFDATSQDLDASWTRQNMDENAITQRILEFSNEQVQSRMDLLSPQAEMFKKYLSYLGVDEFVNRVLMEVGYEVSIDGLGIDRKNFRDKLRNMLF